MMGDDATACRRRRLASHQNRNPVVMGDDATACRRRRLASHQNRDPVVIGDDATASRRRRLASHQNRDPVVMGDAATASRRRRLPSILLAGKPRLTDSMNETTARAKSKGGFTMAVSFWMADPPQLSIFSIHSSRPPHLQHSVNFNFTVLPHVVGVGAEGRFILFRAAFDDSGLSEYFLYKAGDGESAPLLNRIPSPYEYHDGERDDLRGVREFGILQLRGGGHEYLVAALCLAPSSDDYHLRIYSSERKSWSTCTLPNPCPGVDRIIPDKVITLGDDGLLGWVDLSQGLLMCNLRQDHHPSFFIPLPELLPGNRYKQKCPIPPSPFAKKKNKIEDKYHPNLWWFRDLACVDGVLKLIEVENLAPENRSDKDDVINDLDLIMSLKRKAVDWNPKQLPFRGAWRAVTWTRTVSTPNWSNCWRRTCTADVTKILVNDDGSGHSSLLSGLKGEKLTFRDLYSAFPILSPDGDDVLYLKSLVEPSDKDGWVAAVDLRNKAVKAIVKYYLPDDMYYYSFRDPAEHPFRACTLSLHLDMTPGIEVSACRKITQGASSSANHPSNTSIHVGELNSCKQRSEMQKRLEFFRKFRDARNVVGMKNSPIYQQFDEKLLELEREAVCELEWKKEQKAPQPSLNSRSGARYNRYSQQLSVPNSFAHDAHTDYVNYQHQWEQHAPPSQCHPTPSEAPQPCLNSRSGARYNRYSQQLSVPNSFAHDAHTDYVNYQH